MTLRSALPLCALLVGGVASAEHNHEPYPIGPRATGMAGAYTAIGDDAAGVYYNPAAPAMAEAETISLSTSLYGFVGGKEDSALGKGKDYSYNVYQVIPSSVSTLIRIPKLKRHGGGLSNWTFTFNMFTPATYETSARVTINDGETTLYRSVSDKMLMVGFGFAYRFSDRLAVGGTLYGLYHQYTSNFDFTDVFQTMEPGVNDVAQLTLSEEALNFGVAGALGVRWEPT
jgi:long-chain fatty acid transport protein